jgi:hypothetical protein
MQRMPSRFSPGNVWKSGYLEDREDGVRICYDEKKIINDRVQEQIEVLNVLKLKILLPES